MSVREIAAKTLENVLAGPMSRDNHQAYELVTRALRLRDREAEGHVWVDYMFIAACYAASTGNKSLLVAAVKRIKKRFPNYDPSIRFRYRDIIPEGVNIEEIAEDSYHGRALSWRIPAIDQMNQFCESHKDFSFGDRLGEYFPGARSMAIKQDKR
jgi:hypothetical protein